MRNYQLYRTNVLLGGQMKTDLMLRAVGTQFDIQNFHLSPLSHYSSYSFSPDENLLLYKHQDNIRDFYKKTEGSFYEVFLTPELSHNWPIVNATGKSEQQTYNDTYIAGCRRIDYKTYGKQFGLLVPLWLELVESEIRFEVSLYGTTETHNKKINPEIDNLLTTRSLTITPDTEFGKYLFDYLKYIRISSAPVIEDTGSSDSGSSDDDQKKETDNDSVINIQFGKSAYIHGLECTSGNIVTKDIGPLSYNIISRERPLMEIDNMIIQNFPNNHMICKQLFNFNLCFNIDDFFKSAVFTGLYGEAFRVKVNVYVDGQLLDKKDLYSNYENIPVHELSNTENENVIVQSYGKSNVLDYLKDSQCLDLVTKNKLSQGIIHWSLNGQNDYLFNTYGGFAGIVNGSKQLYEQGTYTTDLDGMLAPSLTDCDWVNYMEQMDINDILIHQDRDPKNYKGYSVLSKKMTVFSNAHIVHGIKYENTYSDNENYPIIDGMYQIDTIYLLGTFGTPNLSKGDVVWTYTSNTDTQYTLVDLLSDSDKNLIMRDEDAYKQSQNVVNSKMYILCISGYEPAEQRYSFKNFSDAIKTYDGDSPFICALRDVIQSSTKPTTILFKKSIGQISLPGPSKNIKEFKYYKVNSDVERSVMRYDGKIVPTFIDVDDNVFINKLYYKYTYSYKSYIDTPFKTYGGTKYEPCYPSIGYFAIGNVDMDKDSYETPPTVLNPKMERPWFNNSIILYVLTKISFRVEGTSLVEGIKDELKRIYSTCDDSTINAIYELYDVKYDWEYASKDNIDNYIYTVKMTLK